MDVNAQTLEDKLVQMYPEIRTHQLDIGLNFDGAKGAWIVHLKRGKHELATHLEAKDAEEGN